MAKDTLDTAELPPAPDERPDDRFVPLLAEDVAAHLAGDAARFGPEAERLTEVFAALRDVIDQEAESCRRWLQRIYAPVNPDRDTRPADPGAEPATGDAVAQVERVGAYLLDKANFDPLSTVEISDVVQQANALGLKVRLNPERVERLSVWVRGPTTVTQRIRTWRHPLRGEQCEVPIYRRLALIVKLTEEPAVRLKLFKDIPVANVEALLPHAEVSMTTLDRLKLTFGSAGALGSAGVKVFQAVVGGAVALGALVWALLVGMVMLAVRAFTGYRRSRLQRDAQRTRQLYFQNLSSNAAVIHSLLAMISEEEAKEALLAYAFCHAVDGPPPDVPTLDRRIEEYVERELGFRVDFDAVDGVETLTRLGLLDAEGQLRARPPAGAICLLREHWRERRSWTYHQDRVAARR